MQLFNNNLENGFCDAEMTSLQLNSYFWPEVEVGSTAALPCVLGPLILNGMARRTCNPDTAQWDPVNLDECFTSKSLTLALKQNEPILKFY